MFIYPSTLINKLPNEVINIIKPSQKYISSFHLSTLTKARLIDPTSKSEYEYISNIHLPTIQQVLNAPLVTLEHNQKSLKNHFVTTKDVNRVRNSISNYKHGDSLDFINDTNHEQHDHNDKITKTKVNNNLNPEICTVRVLQKYENVHKIKYVITDKLLGIAILEQSLYNERCIIEIDKILTEISYEHNPTLIKDKARAFIYKFSSILHPKGKSPNQSLTDILNDIHYAPNGCFIWNPIYKAHKVDNNNIHTPKVRPVISGNRSPLKPVLRLMAEGCKILINVLQHKYNIINIVQDSFQVIELINKYRNTIFHPNDKILTFDLVSFYTELQSNLIYDKLDFIYNLFKKEYDTKSIYKYHIYMKITKMIKEGYKIASKYCIIKIDNKYYIQKQGVIMGANFAPNLANLVILIHLIQEEIYKNKAIKLNLRMVDDTLLILDSKHNTNINDIFKKYYPQSLEFTSENMKENTIKFLDIKLMIINNTLQYIIQFKALKLEFFVPFQSNHPNHMKINIIQNMVKRAVILCSNSNLFFHAFIALRIRFQKSGYPNSFPLKYMNIDEYKNRKQLMNDLNTKGHDKLKIALQCIKIKYKPSWIPDNEKGYIPIIYDKILSNSQYSLKQYLKLKYPYKRMVHKLNNSIQKTLRCKDANYQM